MTPLIGAMGIVAIVLLISALASGIVERAPLSFPMIFLGLGFALGGGGLKVISVDLHSPLLEIVATVSLALVLFLDAVNLQLDELKANWRVPFLTLGPGTFAVIAGVAAAAYLIVGATPVQSLLLGAALASTDPVVLRDIIRNERIPRSVRQALGVEAGMNDIVVLPIVLVLIAVLTVTPGESQDWPRFFIQILVLSPLVGLAVGGIGSNLMGRADATFTIRKEYQALYGIGLVLAAFAAGRLVDGDGFLAAFFAGLAVTLFNTSLCDCFMEYGEVTAEMLMMLTFVLFGALLSTLPGTIALLPALALAVIALGIIRPTALFLVLKRARMSNSARLFIGWFGPRGLSSLLLALLAVQAGVPQAEWLMAVVGAVVVVSVIVHGVTATPVSAWYAHKVAKARQTMEEERESTFTGLFEPDASEVKRITPDDLAAQMQSAHPPVVLDVRSRAHYESDEGQIPGSVRVVPDQVGDWAAAAQKDQPVVAYCHCPDEAASGRVARFLKEQGFEASALKGGYAAWVAAYPIEPKGTAQLKMSQITTEVPVIMP